jgi:hypothetical protein
VRDLPFCQPGRFYKGNLHTHSANSDGMLAPGEIADFYRGAGYDFVAVTDHFRERYNFPVTDTAPYRTDDFTTLIGAELHSMGTPLGGEWHIVAAGLPLDFAPARPSETGADLARRAHEAGAWLSVAHPGSQGLVAEDFFALQYADAAEVHNERCKFHDDRCDGWFLADAVASAGHVIGAVAVDDAHFDGVPDHGLAFTMVRAERLDPDSILGALKKRHYYASQGPQICDVQLADGALMVKSSPAVSVVASGRGGPARAVLGEGITTCYLPLADFLPGGYVRVTVRDSAERRAWTNPIYL